MKSKVIIVLAIFMAVLYLLSPEAAAGSEITGKVTLYSKDKKKVLSSENLVVYIEKVENGAPFLPPQEHPTLRQKGRKFHPEVLPILRGTTVDFPNDDNIFHNVFSHSKLKAFDLGNYKQGVSKSVTFENEGLVKVYCNIHFHMVSYILVLENPYFALLGAKGEYVLSDLPAGNYKLKAWQRFGPEVEKTFTLKPEEQLRLDLEIVQDKVTISHKNKHGKNYTFPNARGYDS